MSFLSIPPGGAYGQGSLGWPVRGGHRLSLLARCICPSAMAVCVSGFSFVLRTFFRLESKNYECWARDYQHLYCKFSNTNIYCQIAFKSLLVEHCVSDGFTAQSRQALCCWLGGASGLIGKYGVPLKKLCFFHYF